MDVEFLDVDPVGEYVRLWDINQRIQEPCVYNERMDPTDHLSDAVFKSHFRFDKESVIRMAALFALRSLMIMVCRLHLCSRCVLRSTTSQARISIVSRRTVVTRQSWLSGMLGCLFGMGEGCIGGGCGALHQDAH
jgi:hypothetical protein